jgi:Cu(I)/Ag(I) efflux system membrane protein CusA/SilA
MISTGLRAQLGVKLFGEDRERLQQAARLVERVVQQVPGATGVAPSRTQTRPYFEITVDRDALVTYGLHMQEVLEVVDAGLGGVPVTTTLEGRQRIGVQVRLQRSEREDLTRLRDVPIITAAGKAIPLGQVARLERVEGPSEIASENGRLRATVQANVAGRDLGGFVEEVKARVQREVAPQLAAEGITLEYSGEHEHQLRAARTLRMIIPVVLLIIFALLHQLYRRAREAAHVLLAVPFALSGGVFLQAAMGVPFSVAVWVGYIGLFGTAIQTAVVMVVYLEEAVVRKQRALGRDFDLATLTAAVKEGARLRLRPKVMTVGTIIASLLPMIWSTRTGSEVMRPLAIPILGGMISSLLHILILTPALFLTLRARDLRKETPASQVAS